MLEDTTTKLKHKTIEDDLVGEIKSGRLEVGMQIPTVRLISRNYGVSQTTAHKAISTLVGKGYLEGTQGRGTFVRDWTKLEQRPADTISLMLPKSDIQEPGFPVEFMHCASVAAEKAGYHLVFCALGDDEEYCAPRVMRNKQTLGNLFLGVPSEEQMEVLLKEDVPHLFVGNCRNTFGQPSVRHDMADGGYRITRALLELERGPVWLLIEPTLNVHYSHELSLGYQRALQERPNPVYRVYMGGLNNHPSGYEELTAQMAASGAEHYCILAHYESHVVGLMAQLERVGIGPDQTTIVVVDRCERDSAYVNRLCLCELSPALLAEESVRRIIEAGGDKSLLTGKSYKLQVEKVDDRRKPLRFSWI